MAHLSIIVPVFEAENCLWELWRRLKPALENISSDFEVILIDDNSQDRSWQIILELAKQDSRIKGLKLSRNFGQHYGITAGLDYCSGDYAVVMDCDLQDQPEEIPRLYAKAQEGYDIVLAKRIHRQDTYLKKLYSRIFYKVLNYFLDEKYDAQVGNFRLISKKVILTFRSLRENLRFFGAMLNWMGYKTTSIAVVHARTKQNNSTYTFKKLCRLGSHAIIAYSEKPLHFAIPLGFLLTVFSVVYGIYLIMNAYIYGEKISGLTNLIVSLYFIGGVIIWILGIIGIYLAKTFAEAKKRPLYIIDEAVN